MCWKRMYKRPPPKTRTLQELEHYAANRLNSPMLPSLEDSIQAGTEIATFVYRELREHGYDPESRTATMLKSPKIIDPETNYLLSNKVGERRNESGYKFPTVEIAALRDADIEDFKSGGLDPDTFVGNGSEKMEMILTYRVNEIGQLQVARTDRLFRLSANDKK